MVCKRDDIDKRFFVGVNSPYDLDRLVYQFPPAINFYSGFDRFLDSTDLPVEWICSGQWAEVTLYLVNRNTVIVIPGAPDADLCQMITDRQRMFLWYEDLEFYMRKVFHFSYFLTFSP